MFRCEQNFVRRQSPMMKAQIRESILPSQRIERAILLSRGQKVMLDADLAELYGVETKALNRAVRRNMGRFPADFMFQLTGKEAERLRCQIGTSNLRSHIAASMAPRSARMSTRCARSWV